MHTQHAIDYRQQSGQGCLAVCLAYVCSLQPGRRYEHYMVSVAVFKDRDNFVLGTVRALQTCHPAAASRVCIIIGRKRYAQYLSQTNRDVVSGIEYGDVYDLVRTTPAPHPLAVYVDRYEFGAGYHYPHFVLVVAATPKTLTIFDPWDGSTRRYSRTRIVRAVRMLDRHLGVCPAAIMQRELIA